jgi:hypothetical protein
MSELVFEAMQEEDGGFCAEVNPIIPAGSQNNTISLPDSFTPPWSVVL